MQYKSCPHCTEEVTTDSDFCPHCGILFAQAGAVFCDAHPQRAAIGVCIICRTLVCEECSSSTLNRLFCRNHCMVEVRQDWAKVFEATDIGNAELVKSLLESNGFKVQAINFGSIGFVWDGGGDSPISRSNISKPAKVFVPIPEYVSALEVVHDWQSSEPEPGNETEQ